MDRHEIRAEADMMAMLPLRVKIGKNKDFIINMNKMRSAKHWSILANAKKNFTDHIKQLDLWEPHMPFENPVTVHYFYFPETKRIYDRMNVLAGIDKFYMDALMEVGVIKDDNYKLVNTPTFTHCEIDRKYPRIEAYLIQEF